MSIYEHHNLTDNMPAIVHLDTYHKGECSFSNWHENIELLYCVRGNGKIIINASPISLKEGSIAVINSNKIHSSVTDSEIFQYYCIILDTEFLKKFGLNIKNTKFKEYIYDDTVNGYLDSIISEFETKSPYYESAVKGNIIAMISYIFRNYSCENNKIPGDNAIKKGIEYIHEHFTEDISVDDVANHAGFSKSHFSRKFKSITTHSIKEYIQILRCREAQSMLLTHKYSVSEVSSICGFSDVSYFTKVFKKYFGELPSKLKR